MATGVVVSADKEVACPKVLALAEMMIRLGRGFATTMSAIPIENPTFAVLSAGPSFVPSPVTPTISPRDRRVSIRIFLSSGEGTCGRGTTSIHLCGSRAQKTGPSTMRPLAM